MPFTIIRQDITKMKVDAIVNAANPELKKGGGVCGAIFQAAGSKKLQSACDKLAPIRTGEAVITPGFELPARFIIHTAGPVYRDGRSGEEDLLKSSYQNSLELAAENHCRSIAFPLISSGIYGYPKAEALETATSAIREFLDDHEMEVYLTVFDRASFTLSQELAEDVASYIDQHYVDAHSDKRRRAFQWNDEMSMPSFQRQLPAQEVKEPKSLEEIIGELDEPFSTTLLRLIDSKERSDVEVYKRANIDRKLFSKIRTNSAYTPSKKTVLALCIALELSLEETDDLLERAGYSLSPSRKEDVIVEYFIINARYDIFELNQVLFKYDQQLLGS